MELNLESVGGALHILRKGKYFSFKEVAHFNSLGSSDMFRRTKKKLGRGMYLFSCLCIYFAKTAGVSSGGECDFSSGYMGFLYSLRQFGVAMQK